MNKEQEWTNEQDLNNMSTEELRADFKLLTEINKDIIKLTGVLLMDLGKIKELFDCDLFDESDEDVIDSRYDEEKLVIAHRIASKY
ncbi:MAG: hypothetical protein BMS9Abin31_0133 [Gammaproteobacteria bacterium]|nr:MAG: hypothetical protein BMS9Abin31_0133 [Gammaproteobacteria bacterium]